MLTENMKKNLILHPFLLATFPLLSLYASNIDQAPLSSVVGVGAMVLIITCFLFLLLCFVTKSPQRAGLATSVSVIAFFSYGHIHDLGNEFLVTHLTHRAIFERLNWVPKIDFFLHILLFALFGAAMLALFVVLARRKCTKGVPELTKILNVVAVTLIIVSLGRIGWYHVHSADFNNPQDESWTVTVRNLEYEPDIYYIILDGYARGDVLKRYYHYDNSPFLDFLKNRKFRVLEKSLCNYSYTFLSLPSSLNFEYLNPLAEKMGADSTDLRILYEMIRNNHVVRLLKTQGYKFIHFNSTWGATLSNRYADLEISYKRGLFNDEFLRVLAQTTMLKLLDNLIAEDLAAAHLYTFKKLSQAASIRGPKIVFAHIVLPHHPFIFDGEGNIRKKTIMANQFQDGGWARMDLYLEQLIFVNSRMKEVIDGILMGSENPPIIILQSDHGPQIAGSSLEDCISARMSILMACHLPNGGDALLYPTITPVNIFRLVLRHYFSADLPFLEDIAYYSEFHRPYRFLFAIRQGIRVPVSSDHTQETDRTPSTEGRK